MSTRQAKRKQYFTIVELLVVIAIITLLVAILLPALNKAKEKVKAINCMSNLKNSGYCGVMYANDWDGLMPLQVNPGNAWVTYSWADLFVNLQYLSDLNNAMACPSVPGPAKLGTAIAICYGVQTTMGGGILPAAYKMSDDSAYRMLNIKGVGNASCTYYMVDSWDPVNQRQSYGMNCDNTLINPKAHARHSARANMFFVDGHVGAIAKEEYPALIINSKTYVIKSGYGIVDQNNIAVEVK